MSSMSSTTDPSDHGFTQVQEDDWDQWAEQVHEMEIESQAVGVPDHYPQ